MTMSEHGHMRQIMYNMYMHIEQLMFVISYNKNSLKYGNEITVTTYTAKSLQIGQQKRYLKSYLYESMISNEAHS